jgi:hypothetical protein
MCSAVMVSTLVSLPICRVLLQALAQTDTYLRKLGVIKEAVDDTAGAAQMVARQQLKVRRPSLHSKQQEPIFQQRLYSSLNPRHHADPAAAV